MNQTTSPAIDRAAIATLRRKLHSDAPLNRKERDQLSGVLAQIDLQIDLADELGPAQNDISQAMAWRAIRSSTARKFPGGDR